jgi:large subunit ribosomal protein L4e
MFAPTKVYRRWHRRVNVAQRRYAIVSAIAASGVPALVQARGHVIEQLNEIPLVVTDKVESLTKTKEAVAFLKRTNLWPDIEKVHLITQKCQFYNLQVYKSKRYRAGKGKGRNRRYKQKLGPLVIYNNDGGIVRAFRNVPGITLLSVNHINLLKIAPGGHLGRLIVWTETAFRKLDSIFGTWTRKSDVKKGFTLPHAKMINSDFARLIRSDEIAKVVRPVKKQKKTTKIHRNPLKKHSLMVKLNPYASVLRRAAVIASAKGQK